MHACDHAFLFKLPDGVSHVIETLENAGYEAWVVGGWVRDTLRGAESHDVDVATSAPWPETARVLRAEGMEVHETGTAQGTVTAVCAEGPVEVTTYRVETGYSDHRHPDEVRFVKDVHEDLARRDLTINAMAWHPVRGLLDPFGGSDDLARGVVRAVGNPAVRFEEDALRMLRAVRFAVRLGFAVERQTHSALLDKLFLLREVAPERMGQEIDVIVRSGRAGAALLSYPEVMCAAIPELEAARGFDQRSVYHVYDVYEHIAHVCNACEAFTAGQASAPLRWAALLHDVAKPSTYSEDVDGHGHFFDHPRQGARMAQAILRRMAMPSEATDAVCLLIRWHDEPMPATAPAVRRLLRRFSQVCPGREVPLAFNLFDLRRADAVSKYASAASWAHQMDAYTNVLRKEVGRGPVFDTRQLAVNGSDIMRALEIEPGPAVGMHMEVLLQVVMAGEVANERDELLAWLGAKV